MGLRRFDRVKVVRGFFTGYGGCVLTRRMLFWYGIMVGGKVTYVPRWHLRFLGNKKTELHKRVRDRMISNDRKRDSAPSI